MPKTYRPGPIGALLDEYERAAAELKAILSALPQEDFVRIADPHTADPHCRSVQTVMDHVVKAGYGYANNIRRQFGNPWVERKASYEADTPAAACRELDGMLAYTAETLDNKWELTYEEIMSTKMQVSWGPVYDVEQLLEHAIVHILRHRRQVERFLGGFNLA